MMKPTRGSLILLIGVSAGLLIACLSYFFISLASSPSGDTDDRPLPVIRMGLPAPYRALVPEAATSTRVRSGDVYKLVMTDDGCALYNQAVTSTPAGTVEGSWCALAGASIEGRYVHLLSGKKTACAVSDESCELMPIGTWSVFDLRTHILHPVPAPIRGGTWEAVDPVRSMGLFRGTVRSTIRPGEEEFWALTDAAGAAFWTGRIDDIDIKSQLVAGERLVSRPDSALLLSYLVIDPEGNEELRLTKFASKTWQRIKLPEELAKKTWRLESWALEAGKWKATILWQDELGEKHTVKVTT